MGFSAVYLDHHWVLDAVAGIVYCTTVVTVARVLGRVRASRVAPAATVAVAESARRAASPERLSMTERCVDRPVLRFAWAIATWFGCGLVPEGPRHDGVARRHPALPARGSRGAARGRGRRLAVTAIGIWAASVVARDLGKKDPQVVVVDEVAGMLVTMLPMADVSWRAILFGFVLFRLFDIIKPWPTRRFEALPGGWGIVMDDVVAGVFGACVMVGASRRAECLP